jgi:hypothetical protein
VIALTSRLHPEIIRQLVDALDGDHRRVHVAHQQGLAALFGRQDDHIVGRLGRQRGRDAGSDLGRVVMLEEQLAGFVGRQPARGAAERLLQGDDRRPIERQALRIGNQAHDMDHGADCPRSLAAMQAAVP